MLILKLIEVFASLLLVVIIATQVIIPAIKGVKLFPLFNKIGKLEKELVELQTFKAEQSLLDEIKKEKK